MRKNIKIYLDELQKNRNMKRKWCIVVTCMAIVAACCTSYVLMRPAVTMEKNEDIRNETEVKAETPEQADSTSLAFEADDYTVEVNYTEKANIPQSAQLQVREIKEDTDEWNKLYKEACEYIGSDRNLIFCRFLDISFVDNGKEIEPDDSVNVNISYKESVKSSEKSECSAVHFAEDGVEVIPAEVTKTKTGDTQFSFSQDSFSVVGTVVTGEYNLSSGTYIFYDQSDDGKYTYALGMNRTGNIIAVPVTVTGDGYVYLDESSYNKGQISWKYTGNSLYNSYYGKYLKINDDATKDYYASQPTDGTLSSSTSQVTLNGNSMSNLAWFYKQYSAGPCYLGFNETTKKFISSYYGWNEQRDFLIAVKVGTPEEIGITETDLSITDTIKTDGCIKPNLSGSYTASRYTWYKSEDNVNWEKVERKKVTGDKYNVDENGEWLNVALDDGARCYYKVEISDVDGIQLSEPVVSNAYRIPYYDSLQNGSFEKPVIPSSTSADDYQPYFPNNTAGMVWKTTANDSEVEFISTAYSNFQNYSYRWHLCEAPADGNQYVELNATQQGALYQDVITIPDSTMYWKLAHRGRGTSYKSGEKDTMYLVILSTELADKYNITTQSAVQDVINNPGKYSGAYVQKITSDNIKWHYYTGNYKVPDNQYMSRYFFVAGPTAYDAANPSGSLAYTVGNHLDDVSFSIDVPEPTPGKANLVITKNIKGLSKDEAKNLLDKLKFTFGSTSINGADFVNFDENEDGSYSASYVLREIEDLGTFTVKEDSASADYEGYDCSIEISVDGGNASQNNSGRVILKEDTTSEVSFTDKYSKKLVSLDFEKVDEQNKPLSDAKFTVYEKNETEWIEKTKFTSNSNGEAVIENLNYDVLYKVQEDDSPVGYDKLDEPIYFIITESGLQFCYDTGQIMSDDDIKTKGDKYKYTYYGALKVINHTGYVLPETGGKGMHFYVIFGMILVAGALIYIKGILRRRTEKEVS